ncbi:hypothetical protein L6164_019795 [Bauhinia variegata]|uniref:Uncharacterized protein n=1 Tax=Bauhinia variegata TaxID=167791 RepID=A0ACB9MUY9_BAUVA|nr:hypothetical protein L6164_019795 [Bauhinia variegata]
MEHEVNSMRKISCINFNTNTNMCYSKMSYTCKKHDHGVGAWLCRGVAGIFFASLDWFSCVHIQTTDALEVEDDDSTALPLIPKSHIEISESITEIS